MSVIYGFCPRCSAPTKTRERRPQGNDVCENGHTYPSATARLRLPRLPGLPKAQPAKTPEEGKP